jgi:hypothetical protein
MDDKSKCDGTGSCSSPVRRVTAVEANGAALTPHDQRLPAQLLQSRAKFLASHAHSVKIGVLSPQSIAAAYSSPPSAIIIPGNPILLHPPSRSSLKRSVGITPTPQGKWRDFTEHSVGCSAA